MAQNNDHTIGFRKFEERATDGFGAGRASSTKALRQEMQVALQQAQNDNRLLLSAMRRLDETRQAEIIALRKDLETVAVNADNTFKDLLQLAATSQPQPDEN